MTVAGCFGLLLKEMELESRLVKMGIPIIYTPGMKKRLTRRALAMLEMALRQFPELAGKGITVGYTKAHLGSAVLPRRPTADPKLTIRLKVRKLTYNTIGHELTHLLQGLSRQSALITRIPGGEKQCDVWTLARSSLFCDDAPSYLRLPRAVREKWPQYAHLVRSLCISAIEKRKSYRFYLRWLEAEIKELTRRPLRKSREIKQLALPLDG